MPQMEAIRTGAGEIIAKRLHITAQGFGPGLGNQMNRHEGGDRICSAQLALVVAVDPIGLPLGAIDQLPEVSACLRSHLDSHRPLWQGPQRFFNEQFQLRCAARNSGKAT
jgi:hypothetical protein